MPRAITAEERYLFDVHGFLVVPNAIDAATLCAINAILDERLASTDPSLSAVVIGEQGGEVLGWGPQLVSLIDNPRITPYLEELVHPCFRLDHEYIHVLRPGTGSVPSTLPSSELHGNGAPFDPAQFFRFSDGRMWSGLTVVAYYLRDVNPGDGGFACIPGSHKANYPLPESFLDLNGELPWWIVPVPAPAGTAIIFTEAQAHGTLPWRGAGERRTLFYKYAPHAVAWSSRYYDAGAYEGITERQRAILEPPNSRPARAEAMRRRR